MCTTKPIKDIEKMHKFKNYYLEVEHNLRNYLLITLGMNTALRISDQLSLTWNHVYNCTTEEYHQHISIKEQKTSKETNIALNKTLLEALDSYRNSIITFSKNDFIFQSQKDKDKPITRHQAFRIIRKAAENVGITEPISCHSLRKTFGYHAWKQGIAPAVIMDIYNHSSYQITKRYLCIDQDDRDEVFLNINL